MAFKKATVELTEEAHEVLSNIASLLNMSKCDALRVALGVTNFLVERKNGGWRIVLEEVRGKHRKELKSFF